jgi:crossover junction endodeoxyribonuclease RuvC
MGRVLGLDISLSCGYSIIENGNQLITLGCIKVKEKDLKKRLKYLSIEIVKLIKEFSPELVVIEQVFYGPSVTTTALLNKLQGAVTVSVPENTEVIFVNASSARKSILGAGKRHTKLDVFNWAIRKFKLKNLSFKKDNDKTDSILLSMYGYSRH